MFIESFGPFSCYASLGEKIRILLFWTQRVSHRGDSRGLGQQEKVRGSP